MRCLYPDCDYSTDTDTEAAKRLVIDHINQTHDEAHALIPCVHDMQELERFVAVAIDPSGVKHDQPQIRLQCARCGQFEVRADTEAD